MGALVFVAPELSPFTPGGIGRVLHNMLKTMTDADRQRSVLLLVDSRIDETAFQAMFPGARLVCVDTDDDTDRHAGFIHQPPRCAYTNTDWHWKSAVVFRALSRIAASERIDYVEFPDWGGLGFASVQEKKLTGFLANARLAVRLHSTHAMLLHNEPHALAPHDLNLADLERKTLRDCDAIVGQLATVAEATRLTLGFAPEEWTPRLVLHAPPVLLDTLPRAPASLSPTLSTPIMFGSKVQPFKRPDLFVRGVNIFCHQREDFRGRVIFSAHSFDQHYRDIILRLIAPKLAPRYSVDAPCDAAVREPLIASSVFVAPSDFESFCLSAYEASLLGAVVVVNAANPAFGDDTPWRDGENCLKFDGSAIGLAEALKRAFALGAPLALVEPPSDPWPWTATLATNDDLTRSLDDNPPLVSVIVPHFNLADRLPTTLANLLEQTYSNIEILVVDDGSTQQESLDLVARLGELKQNAIRLLRAPGNLGPASARNFAVAAARGEYILPVDADDLLDRRFIEVAAAALERNPEFDIVVPQTGIFREEIEIPLPREERDFPDYAVFVGEALINGVKANRFSTVTAFFRAHTLRETGYCDKLRAHEAWNLYLRLALAGKRFLVTNDVYFHKRNRPGYKDSEDGTVFAGHVHDVLRNAIDIHRMAPLAYLALATTAPARAEIIHLDTRPSQLSEDEFKRLLIHAARRKVRLYRLKQALFYPIAKLRRRYRERVRKWRGVLKELQSMQG